jgi:serine/threonine-protein kinase
VVQSDQRSDDREDLASQLNPRETPGGPPAPTGRELAVGEVIEQRYRVLSLIGRGGNGSVYKVEQILIKHAFALKTLNTLVGGDVAWRRFQKEGLAAGKLDHQPGKGGGLRSY